MMTAPRIIPATTSMLTIAPPMAPTTAEFVELFGNEDVVNDASTRSFAGSFEALTAPVFSLHDGIELVIEGRSHTQWTRLD